MVNLPRLVKKRLSDVLLEEGLVREDILSDALNRQRSGGQPLALILQGMGVLAEIDLARAVAKQYNLPYIDAARYRIPRDVMDVVPYGMLVTNQLVILDKIGRALLVATANVPSPETLEAVERETGSQLFLVVSTFSQVDAALKRYPAADEHARREAAEAAAPVPMPAAGLRPGPGAGGGFTQVRPSPMTLPSNRPGDPPKPPSAVRR